MHDGEWQPVFTFLMPATTQVVDHARAAANGRAAGDDPRSVLLATVILQEAAFESALLPPVSYGTSALDAVMQLAAALDAELTLRQQQQRRRQRWRQQSEAATAAFDAAAKPAQQQQQQQILRQTLVSICGGIMAASTHQSTYMHPTYMPWGSQPGAACYFRLETDNRTGRASAPPNQHLQVCRRFSWWRTAAAFHRRSDPAPGMSPKAALRHSPDDAQAGFKLDGSAAPAVRGAFCRLSHDFVQVSTTCYCAIWHTYLGHASAGSACWCLPVRRSLCTAGGNLHVCQLCCHRICAHALTAVSGRVSRAASCRRHRRCFARRRRCCWPRALPSHTRSAPTPPEAEPSAAQPPKQSRVLALLAALQRQRTGVALTAALDWGSGIPVR